MNKKEKEIILKRYELILNVNAEGIDKQDSIREISNLLDLLDLTKERYMVENKVITETNKYHLAAIDMFEMLFDTAFKYGIYVNYDIDEIENIIDDLKWTMTEEEYNYSLKRIAVIKDYIK